MRISTPRFVTVVCLLFGLTAQLAHGRDDVLSAIPADAVAFAVVHNLSDTSRSIREIAKNATDAARVATSAVKVAEATNTTIAKLGESSAQIGKVISQSPSAGTKRDKGSTVNIVVGKKCAPSSGGNPPPTTNSNSLPPCQ